MRTVGWFLVLVMFLPGCATAPSRTTKSVTVTAVEPGLLPEATLGMKRDAVLPILDRDVVIGYEIDEATGEFHPRTTKALYSTEMLEANGIQYLVDSYIVSDIKSGKPGDNDLCPLIYQKDILVGKGRNELQALKVKSGQ